MGKRLTLEEIDAIYRNKTKYFVTYVKDGQEYKLEREDIDKARALFYRMLNELYYNPNLVNKCDFNFHNTITNWLCYEKDNPHKVALIEVPANSGPVVLLGFGKESDEDFYARWKAIEDKKKEEQQRKREEERRLRSQRSMVQMLLGDVSIDEYNKSLEMFAAIHGTTLDNWGIEKI